MVNVLECCRTAAGLLQKCCRAAADLLQIMKAHYLEMLHAKFEVSKSNSMVVRELDVHLGTARLLLQFCSISAAGLQKFCSTIEHVTLEPETSNLVCIIPW